MINSNKILYIGLKKLKKQSVLKTDPMPVFSLKYPYFRQTAEYYQPAKILSDYPKKGTPE